MCVEGVRVQQLKCIEEERCIEWNGTQSTKGRRTERAMDVQEDSEADRAEKCNRTVMRLVSH
jgi:hypothetical protein